MNDQQYIDRTPPQNIDLEMSVLGGCMLEPQAAMPLVMGLLSRDSFYWEGHAVVWDVMVELHRQGTPPDSVALIDALRGRGLLEKAGGAGVVLGMMSFVPTAANVEYHARRVEEKACLRQLIRACTRVIDDCYRQELPLAQIIDRAESSILQLSSHSLALDGEPRALVDIMREYMDGLSDRVDVLATAKAKGQPANVAPGLRTHYPDLDAMTGGFRPQEMIVLAARPGEGKSALAANIAVNVATLSRIPVLIFSMEMSDEEIGERMLATGTLSSGQGGPVYVSTSLLANPDLNDPQWAAVQRSYETLSTAPIFIWDKSAPSPPELLAIARQTRAKHGIGLVIVDYLQLLEAGRRYENKTAEVTDLSKACKRLARELRVPVLVLSQLSRESAKIKRRPMLTDLRESGAIEQDANKVLFLWHDPDGPPPVGNMREVEVIVAKNRRGPTGSVFLLWQPTITKFLSKDRRQG